MPASRLQQQVEAISQPPKARQKFVVEKDAGREQGPDDHVKAVGVGAYFGARDDVFHPESASLHFTICLPEDEHACVIEHAKNGQYPASIIMDMLGPQHGWEPDNSRPGLADGLAGPSRSRAMVEARPREARRPLALKAEWRDR